MQIYNVKDVFADGIDVAISKKALESAVDETIFSDVGNLTALKEKSCTDCITKEWKNLRANLFVVIDVYVNFAEIVACSSDILRDRNFCYGLLGTFTMTSSNLTTTTDFTNTSPSNTK